MTKRKFILTHKHGRPSTKLVYSNMRSGELVQRRFVPKTGKLYYRHFTDNDVSGYNKLYDLSLEDSIAIRWGNREELSTNEGSIIYNKRSSLNVASDKKRARRVMDQKGVSIPPSEEDNSEGPFIIRPPVHAKGKNFVIRNSKEEVHNFLRDHPSWYASAFIDKDNEFRVHCAHGKVLAVFEKPPVEGQIAWNRARGEESFIYISWNNVDYRELYKALFESLKAVEALGLDTGGVDVMMKGNTPYILEINTAPTLNSSPYSAKRWAMYFDWLFRKDSRRDHWNFRNFEKGSSLIWKNFQLEK